MRTIASLSILSVLCTSGPCPGMAAILAAPDVSQESLTAARPPWPSAPPSAPRTRSVACPPSPPAPCPSHLARAPPAAPVALGQDELAAPRSHRGLCIIRPRGGSVHGRVLCEKRTMGWVARGGTGAGWALARWLGGLLHATNQGGFSSDGQNEDEDKGVNRGGGHSAGRARGHGVTTMGQGVHASA